MVRDRRPADWALVRDGPAVPPGVEGATRRAGRLHARWPPAATPLRGGRLADASDAAAASLGLCSCPRAAARVPENGIACHGNRAGRSDRGMGGHESTTRRRSRRRSWSVRGMGGDESTGRARMHGMSRHGRHAALRRSPAGCRPGPSPRAGGRVALGSPRAAPCADADQNRGPAARPVRAGGAPEPDATQPARDQRIGTTRRATAWRRPRRGAPRASAC